MSSSKGRNDARRVVQQQRAKERRRKQTLLSTAVALAVLLIGGLAGWAVLSSQTASAKDLVTPSVAVDEGTGFAVGTGAVKVDIYEDFLCPHCATFESDAGSTLARLVADGTVTVVYHPIAILDGASSTEYSTRAAAASAAAAEGGRFLEFHDAVFARQPAEGSAGLSDADLVEIGRSVGLTQTFADAVTGGTYRGWAAKATDTASARGITGTPGVLVNGMKIDPTVAALTAAVAAG